MTNKPANILPISFNLENTAARTEAITAAGISVWVVSHASAAGRQTIGVAQIGSSKGAPRIESGTRGRGG